MKNIFAVLFSNMAALAVVAGCATTPPQETSQMPRQGTWNARAQITNKKSGARQQVSLDMMAIHPDRLRMEVSGTLGVALASLALNQDKVSYALYRKKKFFSGQKSDRALLPLFDIKLDPGLLLNICFDQEVHNSRWACTRGPDNQLASCRDDSSQIEISWLERNGHQKKVKIQSDQFEVTVAFKDFSPKLRTKDQSIDYLFEIPPPADFVKYKLR